MNWLPPGSCLTRPKDIVKHTNKKWCFRVRIRILQIILKLNCSPSDPASGSSDGLFRRTDVAWVRAHAAKTKFKMSDQFFYIYNYWHCLYTILISAFTYLMLCTIGLSSEITRYTIVRFKIMILCKISFLNPWGKNEGKYKKVIFARFGTYCLPFLSDRLTYILYLQEVLTHLIL